MLIWANTSKQKIENHLTKSDAKVHFLSAIESTGQNSEHIGLSLIVDYGIINLITDSDYLVCSLNLILRLKSDFDQLTTNYTTISLPTDSKFEVKDADFCLDPSRSSSLWTRSNRQTLYLHGVNEKQDSGKFKETSNSRLTSSSQNDIEVKLLKFWDSYFQEQKQL